MLDSRTGIKVTNRGEWLPHKWNVRRKGYLKIHVVAVDIKKKKIVSLDVTSEEVHDGGTRLKKLVDNVVSENNDVKRVIADGAYEIVKRILDISSITRLKLQSR